MFATALCRSDVRSSRNVRRTSRALKKRVFTSAHTGTDRCSRLFYRGRFDVAQDEHDSHCRAQLAACLHNCRWKAFIPLLHLLLCCAASKRWAVQVAIDDYDLKVDRTNLVGCAENIERAFWKTSAKQSKPLLDRVKIRAAEAAHQSFNVCRP